MIPKRAQRLTRGEVQPVRPRPALSVVIAAFNAEATLRRAVESVLDQQGDTVEIIVVDDGSEDATGTIAEDYGPAVKCIRQRNGGVASARNRGVAEAEGDWVAFLDADDWYYPGRVEHQRILLDRVGDVGLCVGNYHYVDPDGRRIRESMRESVLGRALLGECADDPYVVLAEDRMGELVLDYFGHTLSFSLPRDTFLKLGGYTPGIRVGEDLNLLIRACAVAGRVGVLCRPLGAYVVHGQGLVRSDDLRAQQETVRALDCLIPQSRHMPESLRSGLKRRLRGARYDLASRLLQEGERGRALAAVAPSFLADPGWGALRDLISVARG